MNINKKTNENNNNNDDNEEYIILNLNINDIKNENVK
jgi:hypothetical protein